MTVAWSDLDAAGQARVADRVVAASLGAALLERDREWGEDGEALPANGSRPRFADLYAWVTDPEHRLSDAQQAMIRTDPALREDVARLIGRVGQLRAVAAAAASSGGGLAARSGPGFTLRLTASRADAAQTYVTIELEPEAVGEAPSLLLVLRDGLPIARLVLPEPADGVVQVMQATNSDAVEGLRAADTELVLV
jgi:hypothetical protein